MKNGKTSAGRIRWRCKSCGASATQSRGDVTRTHQLRIFLSWLLDGYRKTDLAPTSRTFERSTAWCWNVEPRLVPTGEVRDQIMLDGTYFNGWCVLIAHTGRYVVDWQWCDRERTASWSAFIEPIPAPVAAVVDGNGPLLSTIKKLWPETRIQRCHFHIQQAARKHSTRQPRREANTELQAIYKARRRVRSLDAAAVWQGQFIEWEARWSDFLKERTYAAPVVSRSSYEKADQTWWRTRLRTRRAVKLLHTLLKVDQLFTWLKLADDGYHIARTTPPLEGGPNAAIKGLLRAHRGLSPNHAIRAVNWVLYHRTEKPQDPWSFVTPETWKPTRTPAPRQTSLKPETDSLYGTSFSIEDGNGVQKGWAGRTF